MRPPRKLRTRTHKRLFLQQSLVRSCRPQNSRSHRERRYDYLLAHVLFSCVLIPLLPLPDAHQTRFIEQDDEDDSYRRRAATPSVSSDASLESPPQPKRQPPPSPRQRKSTTMKPKSPAKPKVPARDHPSPSAPKKQNGPTSTNKTLADDSEIDFLPVPKTKSTTAGTKPTSNRPRPTPRYAPKPQQQDNNNDEGGPPVASKSKLSPVALGKRRAQDEGPGVSGLAQSLERRPPSRQDGDGAGDESSADPPKKKKRRVLGGALGAAPSRELHWPTPVRFNL